MDQPLVAETWPLLTGMSTGEKNFPLAVAIEPSASLRAFGFSSSVHPLFMENESLDSLTNGQETWG